MASSRNLVASTYWRRLNGLLCLYKPPDITLGRLMYNLKLIIPDGLNKMVVRAPRKILQYDESYGVPLETIDTDYSDHPLVIGKRYDSSDVRYYCASSLGVHSSGVCVVGVNRGRRLARDLEDSKPLRVYRLLGQLGVATDNLFINGKVIHKASYSKIFKPKIDKVVAAIQASHQRIVYSHSGVHLQSQTAYDLAVKGLIRPADDNVPMIYGIKCIDFERPMFTLEVTCLNETEDYLLNLVHTVGLKVGSVARCNSMKCFRYGPFSLDHALLQHSWNIENFASNIDKCNAVNEIDLKSGRRENIKLSPLNSTRNDSNSDLNTIDKFDNLTRGKLLRHQERRRLRRLREGDRSDEVHREEKELF